MDQKVLVLLACLASVCHCQTFVRQCTCAELEPCKQRAGTGVEPCFDQCENQARSLGGNYQAMRACIVQYRPIIDSTVRCIESSFLNACARSPTTRQIPKRYSTGLELAAINEINSMLARSGIANQVTNIVSRGRRYFRCVQSCITRSLGGCGADCGLDLPPDNVLVQTAKQCAIRSGVTTPVMQQACFCMQRAGLSQLDGVCSRLQIFKR